MKSKYIIILLLLFSFTAIGQQKEIDSLKALLKTNLDDSTRVRKLNELGFMYHISNPDTTFILTREALELAKKIDNKYGEAECYNVLGAAYNVNSNYPEGLKYFIKSLKIWEQLDNNYRSGIAYNNIANIYGDLGNFKMALDYYSKALKLIENSEHKRFQSILLGNIGSSYLELKKLDSARYYSLKSYNYSLETDDIYTSRAASTALGEVHKELKKHSIALQYYRTSFASDQTDLINSNNAFGMAEIFLKQKKIDSALYYAKYAHEVGKSIGSFYTIHESSKLLSEYYESENNIDSAYLYLKSMTMAQDSLHNQDKKNKVQALAMEETSRQQEIENSFIAAKKKEKLNLQYLGITAAIVIFILVFVLLSRSIIISEKWLSFLGILILLLVFEFINLYLAPIISKSTNNSPVYTLLIMVCIAGVLVPLHAKVENYINKKLVKKNQKIKLEAARKTIQRLEGEKLS
jgi:tetratricopeptide (TPR) repeat protein